MGKFEAEVKTGMSSEVSDDKARKEGSTEAEDESSWDEKLDAEEVGEVSDDGVP